jgi:hypothetical protein
MEMNWLPIDTAPKDGTVFLGWSKAWVDEDFNPNGIRECFYNGGPLEPECWSAKWKNDFDTWAVDEESEPTHWMPLPEPPKETQP